MSLKLIFISSIIINLIYLLFNAFIFYAGSFFSGKGLIDVLKIYGSSYIFPIIIVIVLFILTQFQIISDKEDLISLATNKTKIYYFTNLIMIIISSINILRVSGAF